MPEISHATMVLSIQAIAQEIKSLRQTIADGDAVPEDYVILDDLQDAARELEREYDKAAQTVLNLPPYGELAGG
ncbi:hypothetical protein [Aquabacterium sp.]|uniref:hypothetical protein n=1 Tax=Aquabacterium sp. TaxID=1872578 RepID=UPI0035B013FD